MRCQLVVICVYPNLLLAYLFSLPPKLITGNRSDPPRDIEITIKYAGVPVVEKPSVRNSTETNNLYEPSVEFHPV